MLIHLKVAYISACLFLLAAVRLSAEEPKDDFFTTSDGIKIHYITLGEEGSWVVLIHGYTDTARRMWFSTGIAQEIAKTHRVVALDNRNHGESDKPTPRGTGRAEDVIELMDHLKIEKAHIHGYSMGGGITGRLLAMIPDRFITAGFGGSGMYETDEAMRTRAAEMDAALGQPEGRDAEAMERFRSSVTRNRPRAGGGEGTNESASTSESAETSAERQRPTRPEGARTSPPVDLASLDIPIIAINGSYDRPYSKTHRLWREAKRFTNVILPGKTHLTAIAVGGPMPQAYIDEMARFIDAHDEK